MKKQRKFWGWGYENTSIDEKFLTRIRQFITMAFGVDSLVEITPPTLESLKLPKPKFQLDVTLQHFCQADIFSRVSHSYGKSFRDVWRALHGQFKNPPDYVAYPKNEQQILELIAFAKQHQIALIPYGGGSSVVGGVEPIVNQSYQGSISVDMQHFNQLLEVDPISQCAHFQAGIYGPALEAQLKPHGFTLRHFPQSFEFSTLGGWLATHAGGHFATLHTHIDDLVESIRMITPNGAIETRRLPSSGAGPNENALLLGSEGSFGFITQAWMKVQKPPRSRQSISVKFTTFEQGVNAVRMISQSNLYPSNARLVDKIEALTMGLGDGKTAILILGFESQHDEVEDKLQAALTICREFNGHWDKTKNTDQPKDASADEWKRSFLQAPYVRDELIKMGLIVETFETAITWNQFASFHQAICDAANDAIQKNCGKGLITCRFTHIYPNGPAPYYTILASGKPGKQLAQWDAIKIAVSNAIIKNGGTITHHHAVGRDHQIYFQQQHSQTTHQLLSDMKQSLDPDWILNPGVLIKMTSK